MARLVQWNLDPSPVGTPWGNYGCGLSRDAQHAQGIEGWGEIPDLDSDAVWGSGGPWWGAAGACTEPRRLFISVFAFKLLRLLFSQPGKLPCLPGTVVVAMKSSGFDFSRSL